MELDDMSDYDKALDAYLRAIATGDETKIHAAIIRLRKIEAVQIMDAEIIKSLIRLICRK